MTGWPRPFSRSALRACRRQPIRPHTYAGLETNVLEKHVQHAWCAAGCSDGARDKETGKEDATQKCYLPVIRNQFRFHCPKHCRDRPDVSREQELPGHTWAPVLLAQAGNCPQTATVSPRIRWTP